MMSFLICAVAVAILQIATPFWWWVMVVPAAYALNFSRSAKGALAVGFAASAIVWLAGAAYAWAGGGEIIVRRVAVTVRLGEPALLLAATALAAGIAGAVAALTGFLLRAAMWPRQAPGSPGVREEQGLVG